MKKKLFALLMAMVLVLGMSTTVSAEVNSPVVDNTPTDEVDTIDASWVYENNTCTWKIKFPTVVPEEGTYVDYMVYYYKDGQELNYTWAWPENSTDKEVCFDMSSIVENDGSGKYHAVVEVRGYKDNVLTTIAKGTTDTATYVDPGKKLATPEISFSEDGVITFNMVDGADYYELAVIYQSVVNGDGGYDNGYILYPTDSKDGKTISLDYSEVYADVDDWDANFVACVRACSNDINLIKNGDMSEDSNVWKLRMSKDKAEEKVEAALESEKPEEVKEPEKKVEVDEKYENAISLDIELFVAGEARENLTVPVAITMPIPEGVSTENLVILHYHGDAEEPVVIVPTVNEDGTMTFIVDGFSTFVIANQVVADETAPTTPVKTGDTSGTAMVCSLFLLAVGVVLIMKRNAFVK